MKTATPYLFEYILIAATMLLTALGFWDIFLGANAAPNLYHLLHIATNVTWLCLLLYQLRLVGSKRYADHRRMGLAVLALGPLLFATTALLSVHSAHKGVVSGEGDFLIVQNVMVTLELGFFILLAFVLRRRRKLHGALLMSSAILFMGIALFFTLISFVPQYKIEGPETFYRFATAAQTGQTICLVVGLLFLVRDFRNGWPFLLASSFFVLNEFLRSALERNDLIDPLTEFVGALSKPLTFVGSFTLLLALLAPTGVLKARVRGTGDFIADAPHIDP